MLLRFTLLIGALAISLAAEARLTDLPLTEPGKKTEFAGFSLSPDGRYATATMMRFEGDPDIKFLYLDLQNSRTKTLLSEKNYSGWDTRYSADGKQIILIKGHDDGIDLLTLDQDGNVTRTDSVFTPPADGSKSVSEFDIEVTRNGDIIYILKQHGLPDKLIAYNLASYSAREVFEYQVIEEAMAWPHGPNSSEYYALGNDYFYFSVKTCNTCGTHGWYKLDTRDFTVHEVPVKINTTVGRAVKLTPDETTTSSWVVIDRCDKNYTREALNVDTGDSFMLYEDPQYSCTMSDADFVRVNGTHMAAGDARDSAPGGDAALFFDLQTKKQVGTGVLQKFSSDGMKVLLASSLQDDVQVLDFATGQTTPAYDVPGSIKQHAFMDGNLDKGLFLVSDTPPKGSLHQPIWRLSSDRSQAPVLLGEIQGTGVFGGGGDVCVADDARQSVVCMTDVPDSTGSVAHLWEFR